MPAATLTADDRLVWQARMAHMVEGRRYGECIQCDQLLRRRAHLTCGRHECVVNARWLNWRIRKFLRAVGR